MTRNDPGPNDPAPNDPAPNDSTPSPIRGADGASGPPVDRTQAGATSGVGLEVTMVVERDGFTLDMGFTLAPGTTAAVVGPNGSGKSTLIAALAGLHPIRSGRISAGGRVLDDPAAGIFVPPEDRGFGLVPQRGMLFPHLSVLANVAYGLRHRRPDLDRARRADVAGVALEAVGLANEGARFPRDLSGGQAQRAAVARALVLESPILLLDEPLSNIDVDYRQLIRKLLRVNQPTNQIQIVVTHGRDHAYDAEQLLALENGGLLASGPPDELAANPPSPWLAELLR